MAFLKDLLARKKQMNFPSFEEVQMRAAKVNPEYLNPATAANNREYYNAAVTTATLPLAKLGKKNAALDSKDMIRQAMIRAQAMLLTAGYNQEAESISSIYEANTKEHSIAP